MRAADEPTLLDVLRSEEARVYGPTPTIALAPAV
jgi:hypothetical protein